MHLLERLLGHDRWTTGHLLAIAGELPEAELDQDVDVGHRTVRATFAHMIGNVETWTALMRGETIDRAARRDDSLPGLRARHAVSYDAFAECAREIVSAGRTEERYIDTLDDPPTSKSFGGTIVHVITHNMLHRGEILHIYERLGLDDLPEGDALSWEMRHRE